MRYGSGASRFVASIIDAIIVSIFSTVYVLVLPVLFWSVPLWPFLYRVIMESSSWHATIGKRIMGIYVVDKNGNPANGSVAAIRAIGYFISGFTLGIGFLMILLNDEKQALHDKIANTYVVEGKAEETGSPYRNNVHNAHNFAGNPNGGSHGELYAIGGAIAGRTYYLSNETLAIGRDPSRCNVVFPSSQAGVSRVHCFLAFDPVYRNYVLTDNNSTQGTYLLNGIRVPPGRSVNLRRGDKFYVANRSNIFEVR